MKSVINWFEIPVVDMDRAIKFYEPVMQVQLRREKMDMAELAVFPHDDPATGGALAKFEGVSPSQQGAIIYLHTDNGGYARSHCLRGRRVRVWPTGTAGWYWHHCFVYRQRR